MCCKKLFSCIIYATPFRIRTAWRTTTILWIPKSVTFPYVKNIRLSINITRMLYHEAKWLARKSGPFIKSIDCANFNFKSFWGLVKSAPKLSVHWFPEEESSRRADVYKHRSIHLVGERLHSLTSRHNDYWPVRTTLCWYKVGCRYGGCQEGPGPPNLLVNENECV